VPGARSVGLPLRLAVNDDDRDKDRATKEWVWWQPFLVDLRLSISCEFGLFVSTYAAFFMDYDAMMMHPSDDDDILSVNDAQRPNYHIWAL
jgi:hypothetical protein